MLNKNLVKALNDQFNEELYSAYVYLAMSGFFETQNLKGFASWMRIQAQEEMAHAMKYFTYVHERGNAIEYEVIAAPKTNWKSPLAAFEAAYAHECKVTQHINQLVDLATKHSDHATTVFLHWFVTEQVEEESTTHEWVQRLKLAGAEKAVLLMLDRELAGRSK